MDNKKMLHISKNIIAITITSCMLLYFGYAEHSIQNAYANTSENTENSSEMLETTETTEQIITDSQMTEEENTSSSETSSEDGGTDAYVEDETNTSLDAGDGTKQEADNASEDATEESETDDSVETVVASITYTYAEMTTETAITETATTEATETETSSTEIITKTEEYKSLDEAFVGAAAITDKLAGLGIADYIPTIKVLEEITLSETVSNTQNASFALDLNGHRLTLSGTAYIDFGEGNIRLTDEAYIGESLRAASGQESGNIRLGSVTGAGRCLFTGTGSMVFVTGYYETEGETEKGSIIDQAGSVQISDGYYIAKTGRIVNQTEAISIDGGFYIYDISLGLKEAGEIILPDEQALVKTQILLGETPLTGLMLGDPNYMVAITIMEEEEQKQIKTYYADFASAWDQAVSLSSENESSLATICVCNDQIQGINVSQSYEMTANDGEKEAAVAVSNINLKRAEGYDGSMFVINNGELVLEGCTLDGSMEEGTTANASLIKVLGKAKLSLTDTVIDNNFSRVNEQTGDPGAGVFLASDASMDASGAVVIYGNSHYITAADGTETSAVPRNVYMADGAKITVDGILSANGTVGHIGITHEDGVIAGLTMIGSLDSDFINERTNAAGEEQGIEVDEVLSVFTSDEYPSYFLSYDTAKNVLYWDKTTRYLPEAGQLRLEYVLLLIGLAGFICTNLPACKKNKAVHLVITIAAIACLIGGSATGVLHLRQEKERYHENVQAMQQMTARTENKRTTADINMVSEDTETEDVMETEMYDTGLDVPDDGREYYGIVEIPQLGIKLPVLVDYSDANMKTIPCVYYGDVEDDNLVIVGHNYDSQFAALNNLEGDIEVILSRMDGTVYTYESFAVVELEPDQVDEMLTGEWDLTLFTCNYAGNKRIAVRCALEK